jgi:hypothetical protein
MKRRSPSISTKKKRHPDAGRGTDAGSGCEGLGVPDELLWRLLQIALRVDEAALQKTGVAAG